MGLWVSGAQCDCIYACRENMEARGVEVAREDHVTLAGRTGTMSAFASGPA